MFADMSATSGPKDPGARESAVSGAKPLIEGVPFNAMPYMIARSAARTLRATASAG